MSKWENSSNENTNAEFFMDLKGNRELNTEL